ncbi:MAG: type II secretion system F family protein [Planctomycetota bacterium]|jgi:tight adherence protein C
MDNIANNILVPGLTFFSVTAIGASILLAKARKKKPLDARVLQGSFGAAHQAESKKSKSGLVRLLEAIGNFVSHGRSSTSLWEELVRAGYYSKAAPAIYTGIKMLLFLIGLGGMAIVLLPMGLHPVKKINLILAVGICLFFIPNVVLKARLKKRHDEICLHLPDAVDLLEICVSSGIGLGMAWNVVAAEIGNVSPTLGNAMALTNFEIHLGVSRIDAMRNMATRTGVEKLSSLAATLVQTERFGTSIATALKEFAQSLREERYFEAEERAEKTAVKLIIPMVLFIFPSIFVITAGPAIVEIAKMMANY